MTQGASPAATAAEDFSDVFARDSHDRGADPVAPDATPMQPRDDMGRFAPKSEPAPAVDAQPTAPQAPAAEQQPASPPPQDPDAKHHVPLRELKSERTKRQEAEQRAREFEAQLKLMRDLMAQQPQYQQPAQQQPQQPAAPDPYTDPEGYGRYVIAQARIAQRHDIANFSEAQARGKYGDELVMKATQWAGTVPERAAHYFMKSADPYGDLVTDYKRFQALQEIGPDPTTYRQRLEQEIRAKVLAELKAGGTQQPPQRFPGSLASATPTGTQGAHLNPEDAFKDIFDTNRDRRKYV